MTIVKFVIDWVQQQTNIFSNKPVINQVPANPSNVWSAKLLPTFQTIWKIIKIFLIIQIINAIMDYYVWLVYGFLVPSWTLATLSVTYVTLIVALKKAQQKETTS
ncbi:MAG: hypothetical protein NWF01_03925 [Candidatus Bathyarchaeota archaeon]|nr:hypothetical protein [Candidatus Bathyarchaeota archaeon]